MSKTPKTAKPTATPTRLTALEARQAELEKRLAELERAATRQLPSPWTPTGPRPYPPPLWPAPQDAKNGGHCHVCGGKWSDMTHYVCNNNQCPNRVWCGDPLQPTFTCDGTSTAGPYGAPGTIGTISKTNPTT